MTDGTGTDARQPSGTPEPPEAPETRRTNETRRTAGTAGATGAPVPPRPPEAPAAPRATGTTGTTGTTEAPRAAEAPERHPDTAGPAALLAHNESDKLTLRLRQAVAAFVDEPRGSVEEADQVLEEIAARFTEAVARHRRTLRTSWQSPDKATGKSTGRSTDKAADQPAGGVTDTARGNDTEQLRLVLREYRELAERLLRV
ncbi:hypothetical protein ACFV5G_03940 [Streptomyces sp. NPDC059766]|uniref:hypothetical protein n=1 Tax=Streptomyces sp. NPDC059766 TaxID=3346940 RepID=UPI0036696128